jgi:hypothetical protein
VDFATAESIANAVLYEGYLLYPYCPSSVKNRQRWTFGRLCPQTCAQVQGGAEACALRAECVVLGDEQSVFEARVRFLHLVERSLSGASPDEPGWQEAMAREFDLSGMELPNVLRGPMRRSFAFPAGTETVDGVVRRQEALTGEVRLSAAPVAERAFRISIEIVNLTSFEDGPPVRGDEILRHALVSTHSLLRVRRGEFVSLVDPPVALRAAAAACRQAGAWPVLVGLPLNSSTQPLMPNRPLAVALAVPVPTSALLQADIA